MGSNEVSDLHGKTHVEAPHSISRERHQIRPLDLRKRLGKLERAKLRQTQAPPLPSRPHVLKPRAAAGAFALKPRVTSAACEEVAKRRILIPQALCQTGRGYLRQPFMTRGMLPTRQPAREIISRERQSALTVCLGADCQRGVPQPASCPEPAIEQPSLHAIRIGANPVASRDHAHARMLTLSQCTPQRRSQRMPPGVLCVTPLPLIELRAMTQAGWVVPVFGEL